jgi:hypothetical protein
MMTMTSRRWRWVARGSADQPLAHCAESAAAHTSGVRKAPSWPRLLDQGRNVAEYLAVLPSRTHAIAEWSGKPVCWIYGWTRRLTVPAGACTHACIAARLRVIPWKPCTACCTARLYNLVWTSFGSGLWPKAELGSTHGIGLGVFYSVSRI